MSNSDFRNTTTIMVLLCRGLNTGRPTEEESGRWKTCATLGSRIQITVSGPELSVNQLDGKDLRVQLRLLLAQASGEARGLRGSAKLRFT
jgi:hypothetical protein